MQVTDSVAEKSGGRARFVPADGADTDAVNGALDVAEELGPLRVAVNRAGTGNAVRIRQAQPLPACGRSAIRDFTKSDETVIFSEVVRRGWTKLVRQLKWSESS